MSAGVDIWKDTLGRPETIETSEAHVRLPPPDECPEDEAVYSLVRQLFYSGAMHPRERVLFVAPGPQTRIRPFCEQVGKVLSEMSHATVAVMHSCPSLGSGLAAKKDRQGCDSDPVLNTSAQIAERLWRIPASMFAETRFNVAQIKAALPFDRVLFSSVVYDSLTPLFCRACDGAVLVLTANKTRRESALRAMEILRLCGSQVLGSVLDGRQYPIPESIYSRL
jgi:hypothetical protein